MVVGKGDPGDIVPDKYGRVQVQFHWDRLGKRNQDSSCWLRVSQLWAGSAFGGIHIPRIGQEVIVDFLEGDEVMTVYGQGYVEKVRERDLVVKLRHWKLAQGQSPTLYLHPSAAVKIPGVAIGNCLKTVWGVVRVLSIRRDGQHLCEAVHWTLADGRPPRFYLAPESFALLSLKPM